MRIRLCSRIGVLLCACAAFVCQSALAAPLHMDFEKPTYHTGALTGQDGWVVLNATDVIGASDGPTIGQQSVQLVGLSLLGYRWVNPPIEATEISWWWYYDSATYEPDDPRRELTFLDPDNRALIDFSRDDHALKIRLTNASSPWIPLGIDMPWDRWVQMRVTIDPDTLDANLYVDGALAYSYTAPSAQLGDIALLGDTAGGGNDIYMDEISVTPEPAALGLVVILALGLRRR